MNIQHQIATPSKAIIIETDIDVPSYLQTTAKRKGKEKSQPKGPKV